MRHDHTERRTHKQHTREMKMKMNKIKMKIMPPDSDAFQ